MKDDEDILDVVVPAHIPGVLFMAVSKVIQDEYPGITPKSGKARAQRCAVRVTETLIAFYEAVAEAEERQS